MKASDEPLNPRWRRQSRTMGLRGVVEIIALVVQLTGLDAIKLITLVAGLLRIIRCNAKCAKLKDCARELRILLQRPVPTGLNVATLLRTMPVEMLVKSVGLDMTTQLWVMPPETIVEVVSLDVAKQLLAMADETLAEAEGLVGSYSQSTFWCRIETSRSMEARLRGMQDRLNCLRRVHDNLRTDTGHPPSDTTTNAIVISVELLGAETFDSQKYNCTGPVGEDNQSDDTEQGGSESDV